MQMRVHILSLHLLGFIHMGAALTSCGLAPASRLIEGESGGANSLTRDQNIEVTHSGPMSEQNPTLPPKGKDVAIEPPPVGGAYLNCKTMMDKLSKDAAQVDCEFDPKERAIGEADFLVFSFAQGPNKLDSVPILPREKLPVVLEANGKWTYSFNFSRQGLVGPNLYVSAMDINVPDVIFSAGSDLRGLEVLSLTGNLVGLLGASQAFGGSEPGCAAVERDKSMNLGTRYEWEFTVLSDTATLSASLLNVCGVANGPSRNSFELEHSEDRGRTTIMQTLALTPTELNPGMLPVILSKGTYRFLLRATSNAQGTYDNIVIGDVSLEIQAGTISEIIARRTAFVGTALR